MKKLSFLFVTIFLIIATTSKAQYVNIPDSNFRKYLIQTFPTCFNGAGQMDTTCNEIVNADSINCNSKNIYNLTGIQYFKNLISLECNWNFINTFPLLPNSLMSLSCAGMNAKLTLTSLPNNLKYLDCGMNKISSLPLLPNSLLTLKCNFNQLSTLPLLPNNLLDLECEYNKITTIDSVPNSLKLLHCDSNMLTSLPNLPDSLIDLNISKNRVSGSFNMPIILPSKLKNLNCAYCGLSGLPLLPDSLITLIVEGNNLNPQIKLPQTLNTFYCGSCGFSDSLPVLPKSLQILSCELNQLSTLKLPPNLVQCFCNNNNISSLLSFPDSLQYFNCRNNKFTTLPPLPKALQTLFCSNNFLTELPQLPAFLNTLDCSATNLTCLPVIPNNMSTIIIPDSIKCIPNKFNGFVYQDLGFSNYISLTLPICDATNNSGHCQAFPLINGNVFYDQNNNGIKDANEYGDAYAMVFLSNGEYAFTDTNGNYQLSADTLGTFSEVVLTPPYIVPNPGIQSFTFNRYDTTVIAKDIALYPTITFDSLSIAITPLTLAGRPGGNLTYHVSFTNEGSTLLTPNVVFNYDNSLLTYSNSNMPLAANTGNSITLNYGSLASLRKADFIINFKVKTTAQMGDIVKANVAINGGSAIATDSVSNVLVSSFDPNDKQATPTLTPTQVVKGDRIRYTIRFQNTGTASAINVVVADTLSSLLQVNTMDIINTSHPCKITMKNNVVYFEFLNINLPDSFADKDGSHGFVTFSIKPLSTLSLGNTIPNTASIYFDYNKPVVTNTAKTIIANTALPVNIAAFTATLINKENVLLNWYTAEEINTISFNIQRSINGKDCETIGNQKAKGRGSYHYNSLLTTEDSRFTKLYYRLEIIDKDGSKTYSEIREISIVNYPLSITPNPAHNHITIKSKGIVQVNIFDNLGRVVLNKKTPTPIDEMKVELQLKTGIYMAQIIAEDGGSSKEMFVVE